MWRLSVVESFSRKQHPAYVARLRTPLDPLWRLQPRFVATNTAVETCRVSASTAIFMLWVGVCCLAVAGGTASKGALRVIDDLVKRARNAAMRGRVVGRP